MILQKNGLYKEVTFTYGPFGRRHSKTIQRDEIGTLCSTLACPRTTYYLYDGPNVIAEYDDWAHVTARYVYGPGIDEPLSVEKDGQVYYYHADGLGSITALSDAQGNIVQRYEYDSFGNIVSSTGSITQPYTYAGREYDSETGLYYYRARYYDPKVGRFVTKDPIGFDGGDVNLYAYVSNNPINYIDPYGLYKTFLFKQFANRTAKYASGKFLSDIDPAGRRIISAGIGGAAAGAVGGAIVGTPALGIGAGPSAIGGSIAGFSGGLLIQTGLEAAGLGQAIEDLTNEVINNFLDAIVDVPDGEQPCK